MRLGIVLIEHVQGEEHAPSARLRPPLVVTIFTFIDFSADVVARRVAAVHGEDLPVRGYGGFVVGRVPGRGVGGGAGRQVDVAGGAVAIDA